MSMRHMMQISTIFDLVRSEKSHDKGKLKVETPTFKQKC
jgi:hypothetical protein